MAALAHELGQLDIKGVAKANVADHALLEVREGADALGTVDDLVRDYEVARADLLLERADGGEGNDGAHAEVSQRSNVGLVLDLVGRKLVGKAVSRKERDGHILAGGGRRVVQDADGRRRLAPGCVDIERRGEREAGERLNASAANDGDVDGCWARCQLRRCGVQWGREGGCAPS